MTVLARIKRWYRGTSVRADSARRDSDGIVTLSIKSAIRRHWTARATNAVISFLAKEWKWILSFVITILALIVAFLTFVLKH